MSISDLSPRQGIEAMCRSLAEHSLVTLTARGDLDDGHSVPIGAMGAIMGIWAEGAAYLVEFNEPLHAIVAVDAGSLKPGRIAVT